MKTTILIAALLAGAAAPAIAQVSTQTATPTPDTAATTNDTPVTGETSAPADGAAPADDPALSSPAPLSPEESASQTAFLTAQLESLQAQVEALKKQMANVTPSWKGAPQFGDSTTGFTFKPKGFMQFDAGYVSTPGDTLAGTVGGLNYNNLGWNTRARRLVFGAEGTLPGGFGYKAEFDFAQAGVSYEDIVLTWQGKNSPLQVTIGNFYPLSSLETMTSSRLTSFLERASFTDAFGYNRRLGVALGYAAADDSFNLTAGLWSQEINNTSFNRTGWQGSVRAVFSPTMGETRLHIGANYQHRVNQKDNQNFRYRSRPFTQVTDQRFVDTGAIASKGDDVVGIELAAIHGPLHFAGEAQKLWVDGYEPGETFGPNNGVSNDATVTPAFYVGSPSFFSAYGEVGFYLTGESRGYKGGKWDRTKVLKPFDQGGIGAIQLNARVEYVDLADRVEDGTNAAPNYVNGGTQWGYQASLIWNPMDYVRFMAQYGRGHVNGGPRAATIDPTSGNPAKDRSYDVDTFAVRAQLEF
jgi:phosphate-selective porin OprO and OprP